MSALKSRHVSFASLHMIAYVAGVVWKSTRTAVEAIAGGLHRQHGDEARHNIKPRSAPSSTGRDGEQQQRQLKPSFGTKIIQTTVRNERNKGDMHHDNAARAHNSLRAASFTTARIAARNNSEQG
jgi:hypothetical protein